MSVKENNMRDILKEIKKAPKNGVVYTPDEHDVLSELLHSHKDHISLIDKISIEDTLHVLLDKNLMNEYGIFAPKRDDWRREANKNKYLRGRVLKIEFGVHNIGNEMSYPHMGIVMANFENFVVVVPVTTDRGKTAGYKADKATLKVAKTRGIFKEDSKLLVFQMRAVHKNRILSDEGFSLKVKAPDVFKELEKLIVDTFSNGVLEDHESELELEKDNREKEIEELQNTHQIELKKIASEYDGYLKELELTINTIVENMESFYSEVAGAREVIDTLETLKSINIKEKRKKIAVPDDDLGKIDS